MLLENDLEPALDADETTVTAPPASLAAAAFTSLQATFTARGHAPGGEHLAALQEILATMEAMANGIAAPSIFLASLCPGTGKSSAAVAFAAALATSAEHRNAGMLICVGRLDEARSLAEEMIAAGVGSRMAVLTSDAAINELSGGPVLEAQVLIVTQQRIERATRNCTFRAIGLFHYQGAPRAVRVWDEAWLPGTPITLDRVLIGGLFAPATGLSRAFAGALEDFFTELRMTPDQEIVTVPDWTALYDVTEQDLLAAVEKTSGLRGEEQRVTTSALFFLAGRPVRVKREQYDAEGEGRVLISYKDTLPSDLAPLIVLDASIRVRQTYADAVAYRGVVMLKEAVKDYSALTVHLWKTGGGKTAFRSNGADLVAGIANTIMTKPNEGWLVVTHKPSRGISDVAIQLSKQLPPGVASNVSVIPWGRHMATNEYRDVANVILGGTLFMPPCHYLSLTHLAQGRPAEEHGFAEMEAVRKTTLGEHRHLILQAACRGRVRQSDGPRCLPMDLYIIAAPRSGIPTQRNVHTMFPRAVIKRWCPVAPKLSGKALDAAAVLDKLMETGALATRGQFLSYGEIAARMPGKDGTVKPVQVGHFKSRVVETDQWRDHLTARDLIETTRGTGRRSPTRGLRRAYPDELSDWVGDQE